MNKKITLKRIFHREAARIGIYFSYDEKLKSLVRSISGVQYSATNKCFYIDDSEDKVPGP